MKEIKQMFEASDGQTFATMEEASKHNKIVDARANFDDAWRKLKKAAISEYKTADGFDFDDKAGNLWSADFYLITGEYTLYPSVLEVSLFPSQIESIVVDDDGELEIHANIYVGANGKERRFKLKDLYKKKENAQIKLAEILRERITELQNRIDELGK